VGFCGSPPRAIDAELERRRRTLELPSCIDDAALRRWIDALERRDVPRVRRLTYAEVTPSAAMLRVFGTGAPEAT